MMANRCERCDREFATDDDYDTHDYGGCKCDRCRSLCWSRFGSECIPVDWRARALSAEAECDLLRRAACPRCEDGELSREAEASIGRGLAYADSGRGSQ